jgi:hypothetical protein
MLVDFMNDLVQLDNGSFETGDNFLWKNFHRSRI